MKKTGVFWVAFMYLFAFGQEQPLDTLFISTKRKATALTTITAKEIERLQAYDLGEVLQKLPGLTVKNFGGIGGMKTVSVRGLGSAQQQIVLDGFLIPNTQTGQIDLGNIYAANLEEVQLISGGFSDKLLPVSARMGANTLWIERFEAQKAAKKYTLKSKISYGSFQTTDIWVSNKIKLAEKHTLALGGSLQYSKGNYPYRFQNYAQTYSGNRANADVLEQNANLVYHYYVSPTITLHTDYSFFNSDKGLPGAVILYLNTAQQRLQTTSHQGNIGLQFNKNNWQGRFYTSYRDEIIHYLDKGYLNVQGFLKSRYHQRQLFAGWVMHQKLGKFLQHELGAETVFAKLTGDISQEIQPQRVQLKGFYGLGASFSHGNFTAQIAGQTLNDYNRKSPINKGTFFIQPSFYAQTTKDWKIIGDLQFFYKRSVRVAGFNELYYNQVGNKNLLPEIADQLQLSFGKSLKINRAIHQYGANAYYNQERNKIVAIPTKNLFVWMIQNIGKVQVIGTDLQYHFSHFWDNWNISTSVNYTFQSVTDITNRNATTFGNQIAYFPKHIGNLDISTTWKNLGFSINFFAVGKRYALNENIISNEVNGYFTADAQLSYKFKLQNNTAFTLRFMGKNLGNLTYAYVKYYVMPRANFLMVLNYEF